MRKRPLCMLTLLYIFLILILNMAGVSLQPASNDLTQARIILKDTSYGTVRGIVADRSEKDGRTVLLIRRASLLRGDRVLALGKVRVRCAGPGQAGDPRENLPLDPKTETGSAWLQADNLVCGSVLELRGKIFLPEAADNPGQFDFAAYERLNGLTATMTDPEIRVLAARTDPVSEGFCIVRGWFKERVMRFYPGESGGVLCAMLIGDRSELADEERGLWRDGGVMHLLAISGLHLTLIGLGLQRLLFAILVFLQLRSRPAARESRSSDLKNQKAERRMPGWRACKPEHAAGLLTLILMLCYTGLTGMSVSAVRAYLMLVLVIGGRIFRRTYDSLTACAAAALLILLDNPDYLFYSGFQLSFGAVLICFLVRDRGRIMQAYLLWLWMLPLVLRSFYELPIWAVPLNLLMVPLLPVVLVCGLAGLAFGDLLPAALLPAEALAGALRTLLRAAGSLPFAAVICGSPSLWRIAVYFLFLSLWTRLTSVLRYQKRRFFLMPLPLVAVFFLLVMRIPSGLHIDALSVGQGDATHLELADGTEILIDGGSTTVQAVGRYRILPFLKYSGVRKLRYLFVTHMDEDHVNGLREILEMIRDGETSLKVETVVMPLMRTEDESYESFAALAEEAGARVLAVREGDHFQIGETELTVRNPDPACEGTPPDANAQCIVLELRYRDFDALFCGDVSGAGEVQMIRALREEAAAGKTQEGTGAEETGLPAYEYLKVAHHGSGYSTPEDFLELTNPAVSVISCGRGNRYGHPHRDLLKRLEACGTRILRTDEDGAVMVRTDGHRYRVRTWKKGKT